MTLVDWLWVFMGAALYGSLTLAAGAVLDWWWDRRRKTALPTDYDGDF